MSIEVKEENCKISKGRVTIEHLISSVKIWRIVKDKFRGLLKFRRDVVMVIACGLHNYQNKCRGYFNPMLNFL